MADTSKNPPGAKIHDKEIEQGLDFKPRFDASGLLPVIVTEAGTNIVLMFAHMNDEALELTRATRQVHFFSRSRQRIWRKGEDSGNVLHVEEMRTDCDQDALLIVARVAGRGVVCHTGAKSCFYRKLAAGTQSFGTRLEFIAAQHK